MCQDSQVAVLQQSADFWAQDFARRISLAGPSDTTRGVFCLGLLRTVRALGDEDLVKRCLEASGEKEFVEFFNYPMASYLRMISCAIWLLAVRYGGIEEALRQIRRMAAADFRESTGGKAMGVMHGKDARSLLDTLPVVYRVAMSFGEQEVVWVAPARARFVLKGTFIPYPFHEGVLLEFLEKMNVQRVRVSGRQTGELDSVYEIAWE